MARSLHRPALFSVLLRVSQSVFSPSQRSCSIDPSGGRAQHSLLSYQLVSSSFPCGVSVSFFWQHQLVLSVRPFCGGARCLARSLHLLLPSLSPFCSGASRVGLEGVRTMLFHSTAVSLLSCSSSQGLYFRSAFGSGWEELSLTKTCKHVDITWSLRNSCSPKAKPD